MVCVREFVQFRSLSVEVKGTVWSQAETEVKMQMESKVK
jgi:hypothetical protein